VLPEPCSRIHRSDARPSNDQGHHTLALIVPSCVGVGRRFSDAQRRVRERSLLARLLRLFARPGGPYRCVRWGGADGASLGSFG